MGGVDLLEDVFDLPQEAAAMNEDLAAWAREHDAAGVDRTRSTRPAGRCSLCRSAGDRTCVRCEKPACIRHIHVMVGLCDRCVRRDRDHEAEEDDNTIQQVAPLDAASFEDERPPPRADLDLDWIE